MLMMSPAVAPHNPVLVEAITELFASAPAGAVVDGTLGAGGHAAAIAQARQAVQGQATIVGIDRDPHALDVAKRRLDELGRAVNVTLHHARFDALGEILDELGIELVAGILLDLGVSSMQLDQADRGFAYRNDGPLDMRMDPDLSTTAADLVNGSDVRELARIFRAYGEEKFADRVARAVVQARPIDSTAHLADVVRSAVPAARRRTGGHPATRVFQALRIAVNGELEALDRVLPIAIDRLMPGGVFVVLSYHSLEDRRVKRAFATAADGCVCPPGLPVCGCGRLPSVEHIVRRPLQADAAEIAGNPRSRSVRMRAVRRLPGEVSS